MNPCTLLKGVPTTVMIIDVMNLLGLTTLEAAKDVGMMLFLWIGTVYLTCRFVVWLVKL